MYAVIRNHPNYLINSNGDVRNAKTNKFMKKSISGTGYLTCFVDGRNELLHRLLAETFIPNLDNLPCINHKDGNKLNNDLSNLEWCSYSENNKHAYRTGLKKYALGKGEKSANHKLNQEQVDYIRKHYKRYDKEFGAKALSIKFGVASSCITNVVYNVNWR